MSPNGVGAPLKKERAQRELTLSKNCGLRFKLNLSESSANSRMNIFVSLSQPNIWMRLKAKNYSKERRQAALPCGSSKKVVRQPFL
jgi:hypothetical protein